MKKHCKEQLVRCLINDPVLVELRNQLNKISAWKTPYMIQGENKIRLKTPERFKVHESRILNEIKHRRNQIISSFR